MAGLPEIETEDWFRDWRAPDVFLSKARTCLAKLVKHSGGILLEKPTYQYLVRAETIGRFASALAGIEEEAPAELSKLAPTYARLNFKQFPHFLLHMDGEEVGFELMDADRRERKRPIDPTKRTPRDDDSDSDDDDGEPEKLEEFAIGAIEHAVKTRLKKDYGFKTNLVIQLKPPMEGAVELPVERLVDLTKPACTRCLSVWVMMPLNVVRTWPKPLSWKAVT
ncbi:MAG: hypothetical protein FJX35_12725 [Alphaproteobacteria bacterium]|nr:hypothetical protein [Alphaproteobacteria bacterium]